jgi:flavin reductase (DIM6/NTAB) family NADH-FMN oxidoreductase RutF
VSAPHAEIVLADGHRALRAVFATFATGVTVVAVGGPRPHAMTANSFTSVSLDPPLVLVCVDRRAVMHDRVLGAGAFGVSILGRRQQDIARRFADRDRGDGPAQFAGVAWTAGQQHGAPLIDGAMGWMECALWQAYDGGDHSIVVGRVSAAGCGDDREALLFLGGGYRYCQ